VKVCVDIQAAIAQRAGVGRYTKSLVEHLGEFSGTDELSLFYFDFRRQGSPFPARQASTRVVRWIPGRLVQASWRSAGFPPFDWFAGRADVYHFPNFIRPPLARGRSVTTIHDLAFLRHPDTIEPRNYRYLTRRIRDTIARSDAILAVSDFTAREVQELLGARADRVFTIHEGLSPTMRRPSEDEIAGVRARHGLSRPYLLTVGTIEPRKNLGFFVEVFERLREFDGDWVIAGMLGWNYESTLERIAASPRCARIRRLDYVPEADLAALYAGAALFVFPSLYEGFGFPPLEAMACGTPVVAAATGSLPELLEGAAELPPGFEPATWQRTIDELLAHDQKRSELARRGRERAGRFRWEDAARKTWEVYRRVAG